MQVDGEPWKQQPGVVSIALTNKAAVLSNKQRKTSTASN